MFRKHDKFPQISRSEFREANFNKFHPKDKFRERKRVNFANAVSKFLLLLFLISIFSTTAGAAIPEKTTYQGRLTDQFGAPVTDGDYSITFYLYAQETGGTEVWSEVHDGAANPMVTITNGVFSQELDMSTVPDWDDPYYFTLRVEPDALEMSPRIPLNSVPYSFNAARLNGMLGPNSDIVGISDPQTLTNKTLTSPVIDTPDINLPVINAGTVNLSATSDDLEKLKDYGTQAGYPLFATNVNGDSVLWWDGSGWGTTDLMLDGQGEIDEVADFGFDSGNMPVIPYLNADLLDGLHASEISFGTITGLIEGELIDNLEAVYLTDTANTIALADATPNSSAPTYRVIGFRTGPGEVQPQGTIDGMTADGGSLTPGATYYLSKTAGEITANPPTGEVWVVKVGRALDNDTLIIDIADGVTYDSGWQYVDTASDKSKDFSHYLNSRSLTAYWMFAEDDSGTQHVYTRMSQDTGEVEPVSGKSKGGSSLQLASDDACTLFLGDKIIQATELDGSENPIVYEPTVGYVKVILIRDLGGAGGAGGGAAPESHWARTGNDIQNKDYGGNVGIGALPGALYKLDVSGWTRSTQFCLGGVCIDEWSDIGGGAVDSVTGGAGLVNNPPGQTTGDVTLDIGEGDGITVVVDSISVNAGTGLGFSSGQLINTGDTDPSDDITGTGTQNYLAKFSGAQALTNSVITDDGTNISVPGGTKFYLRSGEETYVQSDAFEQISIYAGNTQVASALHK